MKGKLRPLLQQLLQQMLHYFTIFQQMVQHFAALDFSNSCLAVAEMDLGKIVELIFVGGKPLPSQLKRCELGSILACHTSFTLITILMLCRGSGGIVHLAYITGLCLLEGSEYHLPTYCKQLFCSILLVSQHFSRTDQKLDLYKGCRILRKLVAVFKHFGNLLP